MTYKYYFITKMKIEKLEKAKYAKKFLEKNQSLLRNS